MIANGDLIDGFTTIDAANDAAREYVDANGGKAGVYRLSESYELKPTVVSSLAPPVEPPRFDPVDVEAIRPGNTPPNPCAGGHYYALGVCVHCGAPSLPTGDDA